MNNKSIRIVPGQKARVFEANNISWMEYEEKSTPANTAKANKNKPPSPVTARAIIADLRDSESEFL